MKRLNLKKCLFIVFIPFFSFSCFCGCSSSNQSSINFTASAPEISAAVLRGKEQLVAFENRKKPDGYDVYEDFKTYYAANIKNKIDGYFYLLNPGDGLTGWVPHYLDKTICLFADGESEDKIINPLISEYIYLYDAALDGSQNSNVNDGETNWQVYLNIILAPVSEIATDDNGFSLEFGLLNQDNAVKTYVNVYCKQVCVATCYYKAKANLSYEWFANYFNKNLIMEKTF